MKGIYIKDGWVLKLTDLLWQLGKDVLKWFVLVILFAIGLFYLLTWISDNIIH